MRCTRGTLNRERATQSGDIAESRTTPPWGSRRRGHGDGRVGRGELQSGRGQPWEPASGVAPPVSAWGETRIPYRAGSGRFCEVAAEGTSIRPDVVNRLVFLQARDAQRLVAVLRGTRSRARDRSADRTHGRSRRHRSGRGTPFRRPGSERVQPSRSAGRRPGVAERTRSGPRSSERRPTSRNIAISISGASCRRCDPRAG